MLPVIENLYPLTKNEHRSAAAMLARAFNAVDYPFPCSLIADKQRTQRCLEEIFYIKLQRIDRKGWAKSLDPDCNVVCLVSPFKGRTELPYLKTALRLLPHVRLGELRKMISASLLIDAKERALMNQLPDNTVFIEALGVEPDKQKSGLGRRFLRIILPNYAQHGISVCLNTNRRENVAYYCSLGFEVVDYLYDRHNNIETYFMAKLA